MTKDIDMEEASDYTRGITKAPTREELERMLKQCDDRPQGNVWNWKVADLIRHYLKLLGEHDRVLTIIRDHDHEELRKKINEVEGLRLEVDRLYTPIRAHYVIFLDEFQALLTAAKNVHFKDEALDKAIEACKAFDEKDA